MRYSDGQVILSGCEQMDADIADDGIAAIRSVIGDMEYVLARLQTLRQTGTLKLSKSDLLAFKDVLDDSIADLLAKDWNRLVEASGAIEHPSVMPSLGFKQPRRMLTNPATLIARGEDL